MTTISTADLRDRLDDPNLTIVDVRPLAAYNGWRLDGEPRSGHIPGAVAFPAAWLGTVDEAEIERLLDGKGITAGRDIVVLRLRDRRRRGRCVAKLEALGIDGARTLDGGADGVVGGPRRCRSSGWPTTNRWSTSSGSARSSPAGNPEAAAGRQGAAVPRQLRRPRGIRRGPHPGRALSRHQLARGSGRLEPPLARGDRGGPARPRHHPRHDGHRVRPRHRGQRQREVARPPSRPDRRDARADDPALRRGRRRPAARRRLRLVGPGRQPGRDRRSANRRRSTRSASTVPLRPEVIVDIEEAKEILADPDGAALVSVRTWREHIGNVSGYNYIGPAGRIKGDVWGNCGTDAYHMQHYRNIDNTMRAYPEIAANWEEAGHHRRTSGSPSTAAPAGERARPGSTRISRTGSGSRSTTAAGSSGARTRSTTRSRWASPTEPVLR